MSVVLVFLQLRWTDAQSVERMFAECNICSTQTRYAAGVPREPWPRWLARRLIALYMHGWHDLRLEGLEHLPPRGPALVLLNHASLLDVPALMALDPYPDTMMVAKASLFEVPLLGALLRQWGAIPVERHGRDTSGVRALLQGLRDGRVVAVAAEGRRTRSGYLEPINPVLAKIAASAEVPLVPIGIIGSYRALPPGALLPRRQPIVVRVGEPYRLPRGTDPGQAADRIQAEIAALLPAEQQPRPAPAA
jgi:1-acyl-sn-glycerol-3-phosphate acyltransferase